MQFPDYLLIPDWVSCDIVDTPARPSAWDSEPWEADFPCFPETHSMGVPYYNSLAGKYRGVGSDIVFPSKALLGKYSIGAGRL